MALQVISSEWIFHARFSISLLVVFFFTLSHLLFSFFLALFLTFSRRAPKAREKRPGDEVAHNTPCLLPKILYKHCLLFPLGPL